MKPHKLYHKTKPVCNVTFHLPWQAAKDAKKVHIVGEFNNWDENSMPMKRDTNGDWSITLDLETGKEYQYRFLIDEANWENDWDADGYVPSPIGGCYNSVVVI